MGGRVSEEGGIMTESADGGKKGMPISCEIGLISNNTQEKVC